MHPRQNPGYTYDGHYRNHRHRRYHHLPSSSYIRLLKSCQTQLKQNANVKKVGNVTLLKKLLKVTNTSLCITFLLKSHHD